MRAKLGMLGALALATGLGLASPAAKAQVWVEPAPAVVCNAYGCWNQTAPLYPSYYRGYYGGGLGYYNRSYSRPYWRGGDRDWHGRSWHDGRGRYEGHGERGWRR
jgi:hypothetical protein